MTNIPKSASVPVLLVAVALLVTVEGVTITSEGFHADEIGSTPYIHCSYSTSFNPLALSWHTNSETIARWIVANPYPYIAPKYEGRFNMHLWNYGSYGYTYLIIYHANESMPMLTCAIEDSQPDIASASTEFCLAENGILDITRLFYTDNYGFNHTIGQYELLQLDPSTISTFTVTCTASNFKPEPRLDIGAYIGCHSVNPQGVSENSPNMKQMCTRAPPSSVEYVFNFQQLLPIYGRLDFSVRCRAGTDHHYFGEDVHYFSYQAPPCNCNPLPTQSSDYTESSDYTQTTYY